MEALVKQPGEANTAQPALHQELMGALTAGRLNMTDRDQLVDLVEGPQYRPGSAGGPGGRSPVQTGISWLTWWKVPSTDRDQLVDLVQARFYGGA
ncbi:unnamed protein product [Gadus morhua 'NCC']